MSSSNSSEDSDSEDYLAKKCKKSKKSSKKHKKEKKKRRKAKKSKKYSSSEEYSSGSDEEEWVEKSSNSNSSNLISTDKLDKKCVNNSPSPKEPKNEVKESDWDNFSSVIPTYSSTSREKRNTKKEWENLRKTALPGQHSRELNPYWKDGGTGLPEENKDSSNVTVNVGDGGVYWLKKSYQRAKEQAKDENKTLEEVAKERWGSLEKFYELLEEAQEKASKSSNINKNYDDDDGEKSKKRGFRRPGENSDSDKSGDERRSKSKSSYDTHKSTISRENKSYYKKSHRDRNSRYDSDEEPAWKKRDKNQILNHKRVADEIIIPPKEAIISTSTAASLNKLEIKNNVETSDITNNSQEQEEKAPDILTDKEMNELSAKIIKAEMFGNITLATELKLKHEKAEELRQNFIKNGGDISGQTKSGGKVVTKVIMGSSSARKSKDKPSETHQDGKRVRYFPDDDKQSLKSMFEKEKLNTVEDGNAMFSRLAGKAIKTNSNDDYDLDDIFADKASSSKKIEREKEREVQKVLYDEKQLQKTLNDCQWCFDGQKLEKNIVIAMGESSFLCVPPFKSICEGHCLIVPMSHISSSTELDEDVWAEMQKFRRALVQMFQNKSEDLVIFETAVFLKNHPHMYWECVPIPKETGELAPIYFKKAIQECETEWSQNKKLIDLRGRDVRKSVPKGLPYFFVDFGMDSGFAHVIEDERNFPKNFAQEIVGGMMELDHEMWRKHRREDFKAQREKVLKFVAEWKDYDWTRETS